MALPNVGAECRVQVTGRVTGREADDTDDIRPSTESRPKRSPSEKTVGPPWRGSWAGLGAAPAALLRPQLPCHPASSGFNVSFPPVKYKSAGTPVTSSLPEVLPELGGLTGPEVTLKATGPSSVPEVFQTVKEPKVCVAMHKYRIMSIVSQNLHAFRSEGIACTCIMHK